MSPHSSCVAPRLPEIDSALQTLSEILQQLTNQKSSIEDDIHATFDELQKTLNVRKSVLLMELEVNYGLKQKVNSQSSIWLTRAECSFSVMFGCLVLTLVLSGCGHTNDKCCLSFLISVKHFLVFIYLLEGAAWTRKSYKELLECITKGNNTETHNIDLITKAFNLSQAAHQAVFADLCVRGSAGLIGD